MHGVEYLQELDQVCMPRQLCKYSTQFTLLTTFQQVKHINQYIPEMVSLLFRTHLIIPYCLKDNQGECRLQTILTSQWDWEGGVVSTKLN